MNIGIDTLHNLSYKDLAYYTYDNNLVEYAKRHSYYIACKKDNFSALWKMGGITSFLERR